MGVQLDRQLRGRLQRADQAVRLIGNQQACHILDADGIGSHALDLFCDVHPVVQRVGVAQRIGQGYLRVSAFLVAGLHRAFQVAQIVQAVKDTDDIDSVCDGLLYEVFHHIVRVMAVSQNILASEKHLQLRVLESRSQLSQSLPRILMQETKGSVKGSAAPALHSRIADLVHLLRDGKHDLGGHSGGDQGLMGVTQYSFHNFNRFRV